MSNNSLPQLITSTTINVIGELTKNINNDEQFKHHLHPPVEFPSSIEIEEKEILLQNCFESDRFVQFQYTVSCFFWIFFGFYVYLLSNITSNL